MIVFGRLTWLASVASLDFDWPLITHYFLFAQAAKRIGPVFFQAEDGIRDVLGSRGLGDVYKRQPIFCGRVA